MLQCLLTRNHPILQLSFDSNLRLPEAGKPGFSQRAPG
jgi:hypothetical protein